MSRRYTHRRLRTAVSGAIAAVLAGTLVAGCSPPDLNVLPAPDAVGTDTYPLGAVFVDALNLPVGARVKQNGAVIGEVTSIRTKDFRATVRMQISTDVHLPVGTRAQIRFTTPLGEDYVALTPPQGSGGTMLAAGATIAVADTSAAPTIEDAFAALSLLLNGGGIDQISTIVRELQRAVGGRADTIRNVIDRLSELVRALNSHRSDIDVALTGLNRLARTLNAGQGVIDKALDQFPATLRVLATQTDRITDLLDHVRKFGDVTTDVLNRSTDALLKDLDLLAPPLRSLNSVRSSIVPTLQVLTRFGRRIDEAVPGDYIVANGTLDLVFNDTALLPRASSAAASGNAAVRHVLVGGIR